MANESLPGERRCYLTVVPETQCSVYSDDTVAIPGHAAEHNTIEIVLDHDPSLELVQAYVKSPQARGTFEISC